MSRQRRRTAASALVLAALVAGLALPASAQAAELEPGGAASAPLEIPAPVDPGTVDPGPVDPGPVDPGPVDPGPVDPGPEDPGPVDPGPADPVGPVGPVNPGTDPVDPVPPTNPSPPVVTPVDPAPANPAPANPAPANPAPANPAPANPAPANPAPANPAPANPRPAQPQAPSGGAGGGTATTEAGSSAPRSSAPGRTLLSTSAADPAAAPAPAAEGQPAAEATAPAVSVYLTRDAGVDPGALTVDLARFYGVGAAYAGFQREESATAVLRAPSGTETPLTVEGRQDGETTSTGSTVVPAAALSSIGAYTVQVTGDRGSSASTTFSLAASTAPGVLVEPRESTSSEAGSPRGAVWGFGPIETVSVGAFTTTGVRAELAAGALSVRVDALGWSDLALGDAIVKEPTAEVYCIVAVGSVSGRTAAVTIAYPESGSSVEVPDASQVCGIAITTAKSGLVSPASADGSGGLSAGVGLTIGAGLLVAILLAGLVTAVVLRRRRENSDLLIGGPLPHQPQE